MNLRDRFTERARAVCTIAGQKARRRKQKEIETEHLLLALLGESSGVAASVLRNLCANTSKITLAIERIASWGTSNSSVANIPMSSASRNVIEFAIDEARNLNHLYVGTEHLLLGLLRETRGHASRILTDCGLTTELVRAETLRVLSGDEANSRTSPPEANALIDADREFFLGIYRSAVDFYQPRIERRTGVLLGSIAVRDYSRMHEDVMREFMQRGTWLTRIVRAIARRHYRRLFAQALEKTYADQASKHIAAYRGSTIYVSFSCNAAHEESVATTTVHELAHALWEKLEGIPLNMVREGRRRRDTQEADKYRLLAEGFAMYAERTWFLDLYPLAIRRTVQQMEAKADSVYSRGYQQVEQLVQDHGPQILTELPKRWRSL